jgi:hypothetical protein
MNTATVRRAATLLALGGAYLVLRVVLIPFFAAPHWIGHLAFAPMPWLFVVATRMMARDWSGRLYRAAMWCFLVWAVEDTALTVLATGWEGFLARGEIPSTVHAIEVLMVFGYLGAALLGAGLIRRGGLPRWAGAVLLASLVADVTVLPWAAGAGVLVTAAALAASRTRTAITA